MYKNLHYKIILIFALLFFVLAIVLFVQAVLGSILFDFNYTETLVMLGAIFAGYAARSASIVP